MKILGAVVVSGFALVSGLLLAFAAYHLMYGFKPSCPTLDFFEGPGGSLHCGDGNPSFAPYALSGIALSALAAARWHCVRSRQGRR